jgi:hypothetical protein
MTEIKFKLSKNGRVRTAKVRDILEFLTSVDAQPGILEESGYSNIIQNDGICIMVGEENYWTPLSISDFAFQVGFNS